MKYEDISNNNIIAPELVLVLAGNSPVLQTLQLLQHLLLIVAILCLEDASALLRISYVSTSKFADLAHDMLCNIWHCCALIHLHKFW